MNERNYLTLFALLLSLLIAGCSPGANEASEAPPLAGASIGGPFTLTNQDGERVSDSDFAGRYRLVYFGFTYCPDVCPVDLQLIGQGLRQLEASDPEVAAKVQPIFISVDPERDTPAVLKEYVAAFHPRLIGLTGTPEEIAAVAKNFGVYYMKEQTEGASEYLVNHSRIAMLFGPKGEPIAIIPHDQGAAAIAEELKRWVK
ncbi:SCO family protein [Sphingosinicella humi]|uniref:SCO family protein n=1 Tax=Allosphingosinicella humi TaxID=2068657 RepID=A0A2U2J2H4_9SPHN|nr:SCO family protein [Sphingosinicella humi]PWG02514.1 SCO family protein [Sphingosinicella humi]